MVPQMPPDGAKFRTIVAERREVWIAQSDLFLDTDVRLNYAYVARVSAASKYSIDELESIFLTEVAPIVESNLLDIAGDWAGFPTDWLVREIIRRLEDPNRGTYTMQTDVVDQWRAVALLVTRLRALPPELREARSFLWHDMSALFLNLNPRPPVRWTETGLAPETLEWIFRNEMMPSYGLSIDGFLEHNPKMYPTRDQLEVQWQAWLLAAK